MFERIFDDSYPRVWNKWQADGVTWVIQDLPPEDDEKAIKILVENLCPDEVLCSLTELASDPESVRGLSDFWRYCLSKRMSLGCYVEEESVRRLVALNVCLVHCKGVFENHYKKIEGAAWKEVDAAVEYAEAKLNVFEYMGADKVLYAMGLVVAREYRGAKLGAKLLAAREPLCLSHGLVGTETVFSGIASQKLAARCGFETVIEVPIRELAEAGLNFPMEDCRSIKVMVKKYIQNN